ncbi:MAG: hypothetical protein JWM74_5546 [Myxococcaceae bacterium]|nr:hypothetical protein [Myxococcaceae bacterium]
MATNFEKTALTHRSSFVVAALVACAASLAACGGDPKEPKVPGPTTTTTTTTMAPGDKTTVTAFAKAPDSMKVDKVGGSDGALKPDGNMDAAYSVEIDGPVTALFVLSSDASGAPNGEYDADTLVGGQDIPKDIGVTLKGHNTAGLGVFEGDKLVSAADGSLNLPAGKHKLTVYFANTGVLTPGASVVIFAQGADKSVVKGPVSTF